MKSEDFAQDIFLIENNKIPDFSNNRAGTDKRIYAYGYMSRLVGGGHGFSVEVFNHSDKPIHTEKLFRELTIVAYDGRRYERGETEMMGSQDRLDPGEEATFNFKFPGVRIEREEIRMVVCSFDLNEISIYLFPIRSPEKPAPLAEKAELAADYPLVKPEQVIEDAQYHFNPGFRKEVLESQKEVENAVYRDRPWSMDAGTPAKLTDGFPRREAKVVFVNSEYGFVVVDAGFESGLGKNVILDVVRNGRRIGKVMITKPRDKISGAVILPEWRTRDEIRSGDIIGMSR